MSVAAPVSSRVFDVPELRQRILRGLHPHNPAAPSRDLAICMRVSRRWMRDVAGLMFYSVPYYTAKYLMKLKKPTFSQLIYRDAVTIIDLTGKHIQDALNPDLMRGLGRSPSISKKKRWGLLEELLGQFRGDVFNVLVPPLRTAFPRLRKIMFQAYGYRERSKWNLHFDSVRPTIETPSPSVPSSSESTPPVLTEVDRGHIVLVDEISCLASSGPASITSSPKSPPSDLFSIINRFDITFVRAGNPLPPELSAKWQSALGEGYVFRNLYHEIDLDNLPVTIDTLISFYDKQASAGFADPLEVICGSNLGVFDLRDFQRFSSLASSLRVLEISSQDAISPTQISFDDLPALISTIKTQLPRLTHLKLEMSGIQSAESVCAGMLSDTTLEQRGTLEVLEISTDVFKTSMFNILRSLMVLMKADSRLEINNTGRFKYRAPGMKGSFDAFHALQRPWSRTAQMSFIKYLQRQTPARRIHLSTIDFPSIGMTKARQVRRLTYDDEDRPVYDRSAPRVVGDSDSEDSRSGKIGEIHVER